MNNHQLMIQQSILINAQIACATYQLVKFTVEITDNFLFIIINKIGDL